MTSASWDRFLSQMQMQTLAPLVPNQITYYMMPSGPGGSSATALHVAYATWLHGP